MLFANAEGETRFGRYRIEPAAGLAHLSDEDAKGKDGDYLVKEIAERVANGGVKFTVKAQLADAGDVVDDATIHWPEEREIVTLGEISLDSVVSAQAAEQKRIIFDPIPRVEGIEPSEDPLLELRAAVYLISGRRRRKA
jgi:catalase